MKRIMLFVAANVVAICSATAAMAGTIATIDMQQIFQNSKQVKQINQDLEKKFAPQKSSVEALSKDLQANLEKYKKNITVMDSKSADNLKDTIRDQQEKLQQQQTDLQRQLYEAQNKEMTALLDQIKTVIKNMTPAQDIDVVLPKNALLYSKDSLDITSKVIEGLDKQNTTSK